MTSFATRLRTITPVLLLGALLAGLPVIGFAPAASAQTHARLSSTTPASGQSLTVAPPAVRLTFTGNVISMGLQFQVIGPTGLVMEGRPVANFTTVTQPLASRLVNGSYVVNWRVVHDDGHPDSGTFSFVIAVPGGPTAAPGQVVSVPPLPALADPEPQLPSLWVGLGLGLIVFTLVVAVVLERRRPRAAPDE
jgi:copper resistance protein C